VAATFLFCKGPILNDKSYPTPFWSQKYMPDCRKSHLIFENFLGEAPRLPAGAQAFGAWFGASTPYRPPFQNPGSAPVTWLLSSDLLKSIANGCAISWQTDRLTDRLRAHRYDGNTRLHLMHSISLKTVQITHNHGEKSTLTNAQSRNTSYNVGLCIIK